MPDFPRPQFGLSTLLAAVFVASLFFASVAAAGLLGGYAFVLFCGLALMAVAYWTKRRTLGIAGLLMVIATVFSFCFVMVGAKWIGSGNFVVVVKVIDADDGQSIRDASVAVFDPDDGVPTTFTKTDSSGITAVPARFTTVGSDGRFEKVGYVRLWSHMIEVECDGYNRVSKPLEEYTGGSCDLYAGSIPAVVVELKPNR